MKINQLNSLAYDMVGDGQTPNVFFVTLKGDVVLVTVDVAQAYGYWRGLANARKECGLEDRMIGTVCEAGPIYDENGMAKPQTFQRIDDAKRWGLLS